MLVIGKPKLHTLTQRAADSDVRDLEILNRDADELSSEAGDVLRYQPFRRLTRSSHETGGRLPRLPERACAKHSWRNSWHGFRVRNELNWIAQ